ALAGQLAKQFLEVLGLAEVLVNRGEAHIGYIVEHLERLHDELADGLGLDVALAQALKPAHDARHHALDALTLDRAFGKRDLHRAHQLVAVERHARAGAVNDGELAQLLALESGEAAAAIGTIAAAANGGPVLTRTAVLHLRFFIVAKRTAHGAFGSGIDGEAFGQLGDLGLDRPLDLSIALFAVLRKPVENLGDEAPDVLEFLGPEASGGAG